MASYSRPLIKRVFGKIVTETPYNELFVDAVKDVIPQSRRNYEERSIWSFDPIYYSCVKHIIEHVFGTAYTDATGGVSEPQTSEWKERWGVWIEKTKNGSFKKESRQSKPNETKINTACATLFVTDDAPKHVVTAAWRALNAFYRKDDPEGKLNQTVLANINNAHAELKKLGRA